jgi:hypothetical protein
VKADHLEEEVDTAEVDVEEVHPVAVAEEEVASTVERTDTIQEIAQENNFFQ